MAQGEVLDYLKKHPMQWFTTRKLMDTTNLSCVASAITKLMEWYPEIETRNKLQSREFRYNPKPRKSFKKLRREHNQWKKKTTDWNL